MTINLSDPVTQAIFVFLSFLFIPAFSLTASNTSLAAPYQQA
jgi:hypothetical protein